MSRMITKINKGIELEIEIFTNIFDYELTVSQVTETINNMYLSEFTFDDSQWVNIKDTDYAIQIFPFFMNNKLYINVNDIV